MKQVIATAQDGARLTPEQLADVGVKPGEPAVVEIRPYTKRDFERDDAGRVYETAEEFIESLEGYCQLPDGEQQSSSTAHRRTDDGVPADVRRPQFGTGSCVPGGASAVASSG